MREHKPIPNDQHTLREVSGKIIFDKDGNSIGVAINDGSLDYASQGDKENTVVVIRPSKERK